MFSLMVNAVWMIIQRETKQDEKYLPNRCLATGAAHAGDETDKYYLHLHACNVVLKTEQYDTLELADLLDLEKYIPLLRACDAFYKF